jgi:uncharacterized protein (TIGR02246 family)
MARTDMIQMTRPEAAAEGFENAWNAHEITALGSLFHEDATFVNRFGHLVRGIDEIIALHAPIHETIYRDSTLENEVIDVIAIGDGAAWCTSGVVSWLAPSIQRDHILSTL